MSKPPEEDGFEMRRDGDVTLYIGLEAIAHHVKAGCIIFYFGMFNHCRVWLDED